MKKLIYCALALAAGLFASSCQQENLEAVKGGSTVTFTVEVPEAVATKAAVVENGENINNLVYAVYRTTESSEDAFKKLNPELFVYGVNPVAEGETTVFADNKTTISLELINNQKYVVLFWAQVDQTWVEGEINKNSLTSISYPDDLVANDSKYAAFSGVAFVEEVEKVNGPRRVTLTRPFAQINLATNNPERYDVDVIASSVKIENAAKTFNVATQQASEEKITVEYALATNPDGTFNGYDHYVAMNYIFANPKSDNSELVTVTCVMNTEEHGTGIEKIITNVPVAQNYKTNIVGNLLTSDVEYTVTLEKGWGGADLAPDALYLAAAIGGEVTLDEDVVLTSPLEVNSEMTINLNGKTISGGFHKSVGAIIKNNGILTITGGTISSTGENGGSAVMNTGTMIIEGVTLNGAQNANGSWPGYTVNNTGELTINNSTITSYHGAVASYGEGAIVNLNNSTIDMAGIPGFTSHGIYTYDSGKVIVNGGTYENKATDQAASGASVINGNVEVNAGNFSGRIENYYGTPVLKGGSFSVEPRANFIAAGYKSIAKDGKYHVVAEDTDAIVSSNEDFKNALDNGDKDINLLAGEYTFPGNVAEGVTINCAPGTVFKGTSGLNINGSTVIGATFENEGGVAVSGTIYGTFKNCTFVGEEALRWCYSTDGNDVVFEDCVIKTDFRGFHFDDMAGNVIFRRCEINGFNAYGGEGTATFENCVFGNDESTYNGLNTYSNTVLTDCQFNFISGKTNFIDMEGTGKTLTITNCTATLDGVATPVTDYVGGSKRDQNTVILDGKVYVSTAEQLTAAVNNGATNIVLAGEFEMPGNGTTNAITFSSLNGTAVIDNTKGSYWENATLTFNNISFKTGTGMVNGNGADYAALYSKNVTYNNCTFTGPMRLGRDGAKFNACTFNGLGNDYVWTYGNSASFEGCTFNTEGKAILIYSDGPTVGTGAAPAVSVTNCTFNATQGAKAGAIANQNCAAVEIHNYGNGVTLTTSGNTVDEEFSGVWRIKTYENRFPDSKIFVNGTEYTTIALDGKTMTIDGNNVTVN